MKRLGLLIVLLFVVSALIACAAPATTAPQPTQAVAATKPAATQVAATTSPKGPTSGGKIVIAYSSEPETLDPHKSRFGGREFQAIGATLIAKDPKTGAYVPYLASSWKVSADGLVWDFTLRQDVKFHDGSPLKAQDYAWTIKRAADPQTKAPAAARALGPLASAEAVDDYTLRLTLSKAYFPLLEGLELGFMQPLSKAAVEKWGDQYGRHPVGVGPFKFKEWITGDKVVLERNPDFKWAPAFMKNTGAPYVETVEYRYIPEYATAIAGLEAGQVDYFNALPQDIARLKTSGKVQVFETYMGGMSPYVSLNVSKPPFNDVKVRQAFNFAADKDALIKIVAGGSAIPQYGPISQVTHDYWNGVEQIGYKFDLAKAKALMTDAGYKPGSDGILAKDGKPFQLTLRAPSAEPFSKVAEVLQQQYKSLGIDVKIQLSESAALAADAMKGNHEATVTGYDYTDFDVVWIFFHSSGVGGLNYSQLKDPDLDKLLDATRNQTDAAKRTEAAGQAQKRLVEQAYFVPLYTPKTFLIMGSRVKGVSLDTFSIMGNRLYLNDLYVEK